MKVLVTGGTGVVGRATVTELVKRGHAVRLLSRGAEEDAGEWQGDVESFPADVGDPAAVIGAADGCSAVLHIVGIVDESPPQLTFERINIGGTANMLTEAQRAGVGRFIYVSSLGADRGASDYHRSKIAGEEMVRGFRGRWTIARTGAVVGPGDDTVSVLLRMVRTLPAVPIIGDGDQPFQPVWHEDVAWALAECLERDDVAGAVLRIAGPDVITTRELLELFEQVTDRAPLHVPLPSLVARVGTTLASAAGVETPVSAATVQMLLEGNHIREDESNDLTGLLGGRPEPIRNRLVQLVDELPEQTPDEGVGELKRRHFRVDILHPARTIDELMRTFRDSFANIVPFDAAAEPGAPDALRDGETLTLSLPGRGHVQVRVARADERSIALATLEGHPLAGVVCFRFRDIPDGIRFSIDVIERPASRLDQLSMALVGTAAQKRTWVRTAENVAAAAGGRAEEGVVEHSWSLDDERAEPLEDWVRQLLRDG